MKNKIKMIIENINNMENNNDENRRSINYQKIKYISKKLFFFIVIFLHICLITYKLYIHDIEFINIRKNKSLYNNEPIFKDNLLTNKRDLDFVFTNNTNYSHSIEDKIVNQMNNVYSFLINITSNWYSGNWTNFSYKNNNFFDDNIKEGVVEL